MSAILLDGKQIADSISLEIGRRVSLFTDRGIVPTLSIVRIGNDPASQSYFRSKIRKAKQLGLKVDSHELPDDTSMREAREIVESLVNDHNVHGILIENVVPDQINYVDLVNLIPYWKDVDGASFQSLGRIVSGSPALAPATPLAVMEFIRRSGIPEGGLVAVINRTITVGKPLAMMLLSSNLTPVIMHSRTRDLKKISSSADAVVVAVGRPGFLTRDYVNSNSAVIDVGINSRDGGILGDADFADLSGYVRAITPVPGGVGAVTSTMVFLNLLKGMEMSQG